MERPGIVLKKYDKQTDAMRTIFKQYKGDRDLTVKAYAELERKGLVKRLSNTHNLDADTYASRLFYDGMKKGWLQH